MAGASKSCKRCAVVKPAEDFYRDRGKPDGRMNICKACHKADQRAAYHANPDGPALQRASYWADAPKARARVRAQYQADPDKGRQILRERYWADPEKARARLREQHKALRKTVFDHYGWSCRCCGSTDNPSIDHVNGGGTKHRRQLSVSRSPGVVYRWLIKNGFPDGFQTLCFPCNASKGPGDRCHLHLHGLTPEDVAAIVSRHQEGSPR